MEALLRPVHILAAFVALNGKKNNIWFFQIGMIFLVAGGSALSRQIIKSVTGNKGFIITTVEFACYNLRVPTSFCCLIMANKNAHKIVEFISAIKGIDRKFSSMGVRVDYSNGKRQTRVLVGLVIIKFVVQQFPFLLRGASWNLVDYLDYIVSNFSTLIIYVFLLQRITYLTILRLHFKTLNGVVKMLRYRQFWLLEDGRKRINRNRLNRDMIRDCGRIYDTLCIQGGKINNAFALQILFLLPTLFLLIIFDSFRTCRMIQNLTEFDYGWIIFDVLYFGALLEVVIPCIAVRQEADRFVDLLQKIDITDIDDVAPLLILQSCYQKIQFSACGVFTLDGTLVYSIFGALTTYLVILLQFDL